MVDAIGNYGPHLKVPSYHQVRILGVKNELEYTKGLLKDHELDRADVPLCQMHGRIERTGP